MELYTIAGPNGAGKTTFAREFLPNYADCKNFVNADLIAQVWVPEILAREFRKFWHVLLDPARPLLSSSDGCGPRAHRGG